MQKVILGCSVLHLCMGFTAQPLAPPPAGHPTLGSVVSVSDYGAVGDGTTDNTAAFAAAIAALNTGGAVLVPSGQFSFDGSIELPTGTALVGTYHSVPSHDLRATNGTVILDGSQLWPRGGAGNSSGTPFVTVGGNAAIKGLMIYYPAQDPHKTPVPYPWSICLKSGTNNAAVIDVELLNSYLGILASGAARHYIARVQGQPVLIGISIDETYDIGRVENVHFNPWFRSVTTQHGSERQAAAGRDTAISLETHLAAVCPLLGAGAVDLDAR